MPLCERCQEDAEVQGGSGTTTPMQLTETCSRCGLTRQGEWDFWTVTRGGNVSRALVPMAYDDMDVERAKQVRDELNEVIDLLEP